MERLPGRPLGSARLTADQTSSLGAVLRRLYDVPLAAVRAVGITERRGGPSGSRRAVTEMLSGPGDLSACRDQTLVRHAVEVTLDWARRHEAVPAPALRVLGIADLNPANVLWDGAACRLVDFEDAGLTDPAYEIADHVEHLAGRRAGVYDADALVDAVGLSGQERDRVRAYRPPWAAFWLGMLLPGNRGFVRNPPGTLEAQATHVLELLG